MAWEDVDLASVPSDNEVVPEGEYKFELLAGAKPGKFDPDKVEAGAKVAEGDYKNRVIYFSYPDPAKQSWSPGVFVRMVKALGDTITEGETPIDILNRNAGKLFNAKVAHRLVANSATGEEEPKADLKIGSVRAAR
jgi:hypothetical protein